jgi:hypothetical protein
VWGGEAGNEAARYADGAAYDPIAGRGARSRRRPSLLEVSTGPCGPARR